MNRAIDWVGLAIIAGVLAAVALWFRRVSGGGRMKPILRRVFFVLLVLVAAMLLWKIFLPEL